MDRRAVILVIISCFLFNGVTVNSERLDKQTLDGMVIKMLWTKVYVGYDTKMKQAAIKNLRESGDYNKLMTTLGKVKKEKVQHVLNLLSELMVIYMTSTN